MHRGLRSVTEVAYHFFLPAFSPVWGVRCTLRYFNVPFCSIIFSFNVECWMLNVDLAGCTSLSLNDSAKIRQFPDTTKFQRVIRRDFQHAFNPKPVKQSNSPFCAPQLILFQKRKHRVEHLNTLSTTNNKIQKAIRNLPQFLSSSVFLWPFTFIFI